MSASVFLWSVSGMLMCKNEWPLQIVELQEGAHAFIRLKDQNAYGYERIGWRW